MALCSSSSSSSSFFERRVIEASLEEMEELDFDGLGGALGVADCFDDDKPRDREPPPYEIAVSEYHVHESTNHAFGPT